MFQVGDHTLPRSTFALYEFDKARFVVLTAIRVPFMWKPKQGRWERSMSGGVSSP
jgi:hypothetical protein